MELELLKANVAPSASTTLTFLFINLESSTRLLILKVALDSEQFPEAMKTTLAWTINFAPLKRVLFYHRKKNVFKEFLINHFSPGP
jgi:hypothetical protein